MLSIEGMQKRCEVLIGDYVFVRLEKKYKLSTSLNPELYKVIRKTCVEITAQRNNGSQNHKWSQDTDEECFDYSEDRYS